MGGERLPRSDLDLVGHQGDRGGLHEAVLGELLRVVGLAAATQDQSVVSYDDPEFVDAPRSCPRR